MTVINFTKEEETIINKLRGSASKSTVVTLENIYTKYTNKDFGTDCNCSRKNRTNKTNKFYEWYNENN